MRGKGRGRGGRPLRRGITPARAGKRRWASWRSTPGWDHPRACGEKFLPGFRFCKKRGSPPRVRGKGREGDRRGLGGGITPARAGKRPPRFWHIGPVGDHPRACGEKDTTTVTRPSLEGSPPRVRGKVHPAGTRTPPQGITPARAGKSTGPSGAKSPSGDHPRACGEKRTEEDTTTVPSGSPPRVRGKDWGRAGNSRRFGITPARAGKRPGERRTASPLWDHPRACGEKPSCNTSKACFTGSPPRVRGKD